MLEMSHPRNTFAVGKSTNTQWTSEADGLRVYMTWGGDDDAFDPVSQIDEVTVTMSWSGTDGEGQLVERARQRRISAMALASSSVATRKMTPPVAEASNTPSDHAGDDPAAVDHATDR